MIKKYLTEKNEKYKRVDALLSFKGLNGNDVVEIRLYLNTATKI